MRRMSLSAKILVGMGLGIFVGLFFGEDAAVVHIFGEKQPAVKDTPTSDQLPIR